MILKIHTKWLALVGVVVASLLVATSAFALLEEKMILTDAEKTKEMLIQGDVQKFTDGLVSCYYISGGGISCL